MEERNKENTYFDLIENEIIEDHKRINEIVESNNRLKGNYINLIENKLILKKLSEMFEHGELVKQQHHNKNDYQLIENINEINDNNNLLDDNRLNYISGICKNIEEIKIKRMIFRISRGRAITTFFDINCSNLKNADYFEEVLKNSKIFVIVVQGNFLLNKINKVLNIFNAKIYEVPEPEAIQENMERIEMDIIDKEKLITESDNALLNIILKKTTNKNNFLSLYSLYRTYFKREKLIYINLNKCINEGYFIIGEVWIPEKYFQKIQDTFKNISEKNESYLTPSFDDLNNENIPPTFFETNDFIYPFQELANTYGIPRYKEINPGLFNIITFPFLFGIMFGDVGHGGLIFILSLYLCLNKNEILNSNSILKEGIRYRYILLLMGFFSFYCGLIYNDFMALPLSFFDSCYVNDPINKIAHKKPDCVYPLGMDPKWYAATNDLTFLNSFKMKWSVIVGVIQMTLGIILRGMNNLYFNDKIGFIFEFIPQLVFMSLLFGYMIAMIYIKWATDYTNNTQNAPSIISELMAIVLKSGSVDGKPIWGSIEKEELTNRIFLYIAILCIPLMLLVKPIYKILTIKKDVVEQSDDIININNDVYDKINDVSQPLIGMKRTKTDIIRTKLNPQKNINKIQDGPTDIFVHQIIETIEFALGCVSNTASYLRLWALSLAHAQLSKVFFEKALLYFIQINFLVLIIIGFFIFANITVSVLMGMDLLESFLHTLRLHWVEFQNKFYAADGIKFQPFSFKLLIEGE
jgi:V-type H+-transporting ATPase subunit a